MKYANYKAGIVFIGLWLSLGCQKSPPALRHSGVATTNDRENATLPPPVPANNYTDELQGEWLVEVFSTGDRKNSIGINEVGLENRGRATFVDHTLSVGLFAVGKDTAIGVEYKFMYILAPAKEPKHIDLELLAGNKDDKAVMLGIYELQGDTLRVAISTSLKKRPERFSPALDSDDWQLVLKRERKEQQK